MRKLRSLLVAIIMLWTLGCGGEDTTESPDPPDDAENIPAEEVRVLDEDARTSVRSFSFSVEDNAGEVRVDADAAFASELSEGRILASRPIAEAAPSGFLQRVTSVREEGDEVVAQTRQATIAESFERADFELERDIDPDDIEAMQPLAPGVSVQTRRQGVGSTASISFDEVLFDTDGDNSTTNDQLTLNGEVAFEAAFDTAIQVRQFKLRQFLFAVELEESVDLEIEGDFNQADIEKRKKVAETNLKTITFQIGPVPVVIRIDLFVYIGVDGTVTAEVRASASQSTNVRVGVEYTDDDGWRGISSTDSDFDVPPPEFSLSDINARGYARPQLEIKLYGVAGPFVFAEPYVRFDAMLYRSPYWELYGGLQLGAGFLVQLPIVGNVGNFEASFEAFEAPIGTSQNNAPTVEVMSPEDGATVTAGENLDLVVTASDRESSAVNISVTGPDVDASGFVGEGGMDTISILDLCEGVIDLTITATDDQGAETTTTLSVVVENAVPTVTLDRSTLTGAQAPPLFPGGYLSAAASVEDARCAEAEPIDTSLIEWLVDGDQVSRAPDLLTRLNPAEYAAGDTVSVAARYDDGEAVGESETVEVNVEAQPAGDLPAEVNITQCSLCGDSAFLGGSEGYIPNEVTVQGVGFDPKEGELDGSELIWKIQNEDAATRQMLGTGESVTFTLTGTFRDPGAAEGTNTIYLTTQDGDETIEDTTTFSVIIGG